MMNITNFLLKKNPKRRLDVHRGGRSNDRRQALIAPNGSPARHRLRPHIHRVPRTRPPERQGPQNRLQDTRLGRTGPQNTQISLSPGNFYP
jgi:hypothetical protein